MSSPRDPEDSRAPLRLKTVINNEARQLRRGAFQVGQELKLLPTVSRGLALVKKLGSLHKMHKGNDSQESDMVVRGLMGYVERLESKVKTKFVNLDRTYRRLHDLQNQADLEGAEVSHMDAPHTESLNSNVTNGSHPPSPSHHWKRFRWLKRQWTKFWAKWRRRNNVKSLAREVTLRLRCEEEIGEMTEFGGLEMAVGWYNAYLRVTFLYFSVMLSMMLVSLGLGWTLVRCIDMFVTLQQPSYETSWSFMLVPMHILMMSMGVSSMCILFQDQVREVPLANCRASMLALHIRLFSKVPCPRVEHLVFIDLLFIINSLAWPLIWWQPMFGSVRAEAQAEVAESLKSRWGFFDHDPRTGVVIFLIGFTAFWVSARLGHLVLDFVAMCRREGNVDAGYLTYRIQRGFLQTKMFVGTFLVDWLCNRHEEAFLLFQEESGLSRPGQEGDAETERQRNVDEIMDIVQPKAAAWKSRVKPLQLPKYDLGERPGDAAPELAGLPPMNTQPKSQDLQDVARFFKEQLRDQKVLRRCSLLYLDERFSDADCASKKYVSQESIRAGNSLPVLSSRGSILEGSNTRAHERLFREVCLQEEEEARALLDSRLRAILWLVLWSFLWGFTVMVSFSFQATAVSFIPVIANTYFTTRFCGHHPSIVIGAIVVSFLAWFKLARDVGLDFTANDIDTWWCWRVVLMPGMVFILQKGWVTIRGRQGNFVEVLTSFLLVLPVILVPFIEHERTDLNYEPYALLSKFGMSSDFDVDSPYPICQLRWGGDAYKLNALDLGSITFYTYAQDFVQLRGLLATSFWDVDWVLHENLSSASYVETETGAVQSLPTSFVLSFPPKADASGESRGTLVVAFRGTHTRRDFYADAASYTSVAILQIFQWYVFPILWDVPQKFIEWALSMEQTPQQENMVEAAVKKVERIVEEFPGHEVVLTGHSLGGWFAEVIGIRLGLPAISWSGMGVSLRTQAEKLTWRSHNKYVAVIPDGDAVPRIDIHSGLRQEISCPSQPKKGEFSIWNFTFHATALATSVECHKVDRSTCELWRSCGDWKNRHMQCGGYVQEDDRGKDLPDEVRRALKGGDDS